MNEIKWDAPFKVNTTNTIDGVSKFLIKGILIDSTENLNQWSVSAEDFAELGKSFIGCQIRTDHSSKVEDILGKIISTEVDGPHAEDKAAWDPATKFDHLHFVGEVSSCNKEIILPIQNGYVTHISPQVDAATILCKQCEMPMRDKNTKTCSCKEAGILLKNLSGREMSIVCDPAYSGTVFKPYSFAASVDRTLNSSTTFGSNDIVENNKNKGNEIMAEDVRITRLEASVSALIAAFKAAEEEAEEEKKEEMKAEEELKAEEEARMVAEEEEEAKMVPVSEVAEEEAAKPEEDKEADKKIEKLEASIRRLASMMKASKITPETPEDEPADTTHKVPKITNEPVKSEKLKSGFKFPLETAGMKPGKLKAAAGRSVGKSTSFTGAVVQKEDNEEMAIGEIFGFAASRGTIPMNADPRIRTIKYK